MHICVYICMYVDPVCVNAQCGEGASTLRSFTFERRSPMLRRQCRGMKTRPTGRVRQRGAQRPALTNR